MAWHGASGRVVARLAIAAVALTGQAGAQAPAGPGGSFDWPLHNLDVRNSRYAPLDEINTSNVARMTVNNVPLPALSTLKTLPSLPVPR